MVKLCQYFNTPNGCVKGNRCSYIHSERYDYIKSKRLTDIKYGTQICASVLTGSCVGDNCHYLHPEDDVRFTPRVTDDKILVNENARLNHDIGRLMSGRDTRDKYIEELTTDNASLRADIAEHNSNKAKDIELKGKMFNANKFLGHKLGQRDRNVKFLECKVERLKTSIRYYENKTRGLRERPMRKIVVRKKRQRDAENSQPPECKRKAPMDNRDPKLLSAEITPTTTPLENA